MLGSPPSSSEPPTFPAGIEVVTVACDRSDRLGAAGQLDSAGRTIAALQRRLDAVAAPPPRSGGGWRRGGPYRPARRAGPHALALRWRRDSPRPGATVAREVWSSALVHAKAALQTYQALQMSREAAHVWDTIARLELRLGWTDEARAHFEAALELEDTVGDVRGRAQTAAGLAELYAAGGQPERALDVLRSSIEANRARGSALARPRSRPSNPWWSRWGTPSGLPCGTSSDGCAQA